MDEAENCDRLALIYQGSIIAMDTPLNLKTQCMKEKVLKISVPNAEEWLHKIDKVEGIKESALFGTAIHTIVDDAVKAKQSIEKLFREIDIKDFTIESIQASLEDVFISLIESYDKVGGTCELK
jgi:ABC-2 type transport system ATP-binding protein